MKLSEVFIFCSLVLSGIKGSLSKTIPNSALQFVSDAIHCHDLVIFTKTDCPHCHLTKEMFHSLNYTFVDVDVDRRADTSDVQEALFQLTGTHTWPQVFVWGRFVGGVEEVWKWYWNGHLFSRKVDEVVSDKDSENGDDRQVAFNKLMKSSDKAIKWIENKTSDSWRKIFNIESYSFTTEYANILEADTANGSKKHHFFTWLKDKVKNKFHFSSSQSPEGESEESLVDSDEKLVIAHRNKNNGFSWGSTDSSPGQDEVNSTSTRRLIQAAKLQVKSFISYLYEGTKSLTERSKQMIKNGISKVFSRKDKYMKQHYTPESIKEQVDELIKGNAKFILSEASFPCDDTIKPVCAIDLNRHYTIFKNECKMALHNYQHDTNFSIFDNDVCMGMFAKYPELYYQIRENH